MIKAEMTYPEEAVRLEAGPLWAGFEGAEGLAAEDAFWATVDTLVRALARAEQVYAKARPAELIRATDDLADRAQKLGLPMLAMVAGSVSVCAAHGDGPGMAATVARMTRIGDKSLAVLWHLAETRG